MKRVRVVLGSLCIVSAMGSWAWAATVINEMKLGNGPSQANAIQATRGVDFDLPLTITSDTAYPVQGFVFSARWLASQMAGVSILTDTATASADTFIARTDHAVDPADGVDYGFAVLGVVIDSKGSGKPPLPVMTPNAVAKVRLNTAVPTAGDPVYINVNFVDGKYNTSATSDVLLDNIIVAGQRSFGQADKDQTGNSILTLTGAVIKSAAQSTTYKLTQAAGHYGDVVPASVLLSSADDVQGLVCGFQWTAQGTAPKTLSLASKATDGKDAAELGADAASADYFEVKQFPPNGVAAAIVMVLNNTNNPRVIPAGNDREVAKFNFVTTFNRQTDCSPPLADGIYSLDFHDFGNNWDNMIVVKGQSADVSQKISGKLTLTVGNCEVPPTSGIVIAAGSCDMIPDPRPGREQMHLPGPISANPGDTFPLGVFYMFPESTDLNQGVPPAQQLPSDLAHEIQGMSVAMCYDASYLTTQAKYTLDGSITQQVGAEWVNVHARDVNPDPKHPTGELVIGILLDVVPPYDGQYLPATDDFLKLMCVDFTLLQSACQAGKPQTTTVTFCDGAVGAGTTPVRNLAAVGNYSWPMTPFSDPVITTGVINIIEEPWFIRGDCNFSEIDHRTTNTSFTGPEVVDIADPAAVISYLFQPSYYKFSPPCLDACDANDDGRVDLADALYILRYLFKFGPKPTYPFDTMGPDSDRLPPTDPRYHAPDHLPACKNPTTECRP